MATSSILRFARLSLYALSILATCACAPGSGAGPVPSKAVPLEPRPNASAAHEPERPRTRAEQRAKCVFTAGMLPADTLDIGSPIGEKIPIDHFVVVMQENRSFDHYFQKLPDCGQSEVDVAPPTYLNPDPSSEGEAVRPYRLDDLCVEDPPHAWIDVRDQISEGKMDGFVRNANPDGRRVIGYYDSRQLPFYYALATTFAISDRYFAAVPGPTFPNRMFFLSASSFGHAENTPPPPQAEERTLFHQLEKKRKGATKTARLSDG